MQSSLEEEQIESPKSPAVQQFVTNFNIEQHFNLFVQPNSQCSQIIVDNIQESTPKSTQSLKRHSMPGESKKTLETLNKFQIRQTYVQGLVKDWLAEQKESLKHVQNFDRNAVIQLIMSAELFMGMVFKDVLSLSKRPRGGLQFKIMPGKIMYERSKRL